MDGSGRTSSQATVRRYSMTGTLYFEDEVKEGNLGQSRAEIDSAASTKGQAPLWINTSVSSKWCRGDKTVPKTVRCKSETETSSRWVLTDHTHGTVLMVESLESFDAVLSSRMAQTPLSGRFVPHQLRGSRIFPGNYEAVMEHDEVNPEAMHFSPLDDSDSDDTSNASSSTLDAIEPPQPPPGWVAPNNDQNEIWINPESHFPFDSPPNSASPHFSSGESVYETPLARSYFSERSFAADARVALDTNAGGLGTVDASQLEGHNVLISSGQNSTARYTVDGETLPVPPAPVPLHDTNLSPTMLAELLASVSNRSRTAESDVVTTGNDDSTESVRGVESLDPQMNEASSSPLADADQPTSVRPSNSVKYQSPSAISASANVSEIKDPLTVDTTVSSSRIPISPETSAQQASLIETIPYEKPMSKKDTRKAKKAMGKMKMRAYLPDEDDGDVSEGGVIDQEYERRLGLGDEEPHESAAERHSMSTVASEEGSPIRARRRFDSHVSANVTTEGGSTSSSSDVHSAQAAPRAKPLTGSEGQSSGSEDRQSGLQNDDDSSGNKGSAVREEAVVDDSSPVAKVAPTTLKNENPDDSSATTSGQGNTDAKTVTLSEQDKPGSTSAQEATHGSDEDGPAAPVSKPEVEVPTGQLVDLEGVDSTPGSTSISGSLQADGISAAPAQTTVNSHSQDIDALVLLQEGPREPELREPAYEGDPDLEDIDSNYESPELVLIPPIRPVSPGFSDLSHWLLTEEQSRDDTRNGKLMPEPTSPRKRGESDDEATTRTLFPSNSQSVRKAERSPTSPVSMVYAKATELRLCHRELQEKYDDLKKRYDELKKERDELEESNRELKESIASRETLAIYW